MGNTLQRAQATAHKEEQEQEDSNFTCEICVEPTLSNKRFKNGAMCIHPFCLDCITKYIEVKVEEHVGNIKCPGLNCENPLDPLLCRPIIPKLLFDKWCDLLCDLSVLSFDRSYCPYQDCSALVLNECRFKVKKTKCPNCKKKFCFQCKIPWHVGYMCSESEQLRDRNDILLGQLIEERRWTRCPNCGHSIDRVSGCRQVRCRCGALFCHECGGRLHFGSCKHKRLGDAFCMLLLLLAISMPVAYIVLSYRKV